MLLYKIEGDDIQATEKKGDQGEAAPPTSSSRNSQGEGIGPGREEGRDHGTQANQVSLRRKQGRADRSICSSGRV